MVNFWEGQIDYIIFLNGLTLVILSAVCLSLIRAGNRLLPWSGLFLFGLCQGVYEWLELVSLSLGDGMQFKFPRVFLLFVSYVFLVEFGRAGIKRITGRVTGRWIFVPLLALSFWGVLGGPDGLNASLRYGPGMAGGVLASAALLISSGGQVRDLDRRLKAAGLGMAFYALFMAVVPQAGFFPASIINQQSFLETAGFSIKLVQALTIFILAMSLWSYLLSQRRIELDLSERYQGRRYVFLIVINVVLILGLGWGSACYWGSFSLNGLRANSRNNISQLSLILLGELTDARRSVTSLSGSPWIAPALISRTTGDIKRADSVLDRYKSAMEASACLLLDREGKVVASSGSGTAESLQGNDFKSMHYIRATLSGDAGWYFEPGGENGSRYYYSGFPVKDSQGRIIGAAVIKKNLAAVERDFRQYRYCFLVDPNGYIYLSSDEDMHYLPLWLPEGGEAVKAVLPVRIEDGDYMLFKGAGYIAARREIGSGGWSVVLLSSTEQVWVYRFFCICITLVLCVLIIVFYTALMSTREWAGRISLSERKYHSLVEGSPNFVKIFDREGRFITANPSGLMAMGWREADVIGKEFSHFWPQDTRPVVEKALAEVLQGERCSFEASCNRNDGVPVTWNVTLYPIYEEDGGCRHLVGISTNVTERRKAEEALRESEAKFRTLYDSANDAIIIMDGTFFVDCNPKALNMFGCDRSRIIGRNLLDFSPERQPDGTSSQEKAGELINAVLDGESRYFQWRHSRPDGTLYDTEISLNRIKLKDMYYVQAIFRDITRRKLREEQLRLHAAALQSVANAIVITDPEGCITWINPAFTVLTGYTSEEAIGKNMSILKSGAHDEGFYKDLWDTIFSGLVWHGETQNRHKSGSLYTEEQTITPVRDEDGRITHFVAIKQDVTARKQQEQQLSYMATHDPLTSLPNRRVLEDSLKRTVARAGRGVHSSLLFMDLDNFKLVNDTLGHTAGDQVLYTLTRLLLNMLRNGDLLVRFGGDEFAVLLEGVSAEEALNIAERMRREVEEYRFTADDQNFHLTLSIGMVIVDGEHSPGVILSQADTAMYMAKEQGKNRVVVYRPEDGVLARLTEDSQWAARVKSSLAEDRFVLYYQPLVRVSEDRVEHYEALVRMIGEDSSIILPEQFIPIAERFSLMPQVDRWVFKKVISTLQNNPAVRIFMNLSGSSLADETFTAFIEEQLGLSGIDPGRLGFEITETAVVQDMVAAERWVKRIKALGCRFALDDFGAGFNSFIYLHNLSVDQLKIDGYYIRTLETDPTRYALVKAMHALARTLNMETVAEYVENEATLQIVKNIGITYGQGYYIGKPHPRLPGGEE
ncbi:MAG: EAL domain-containing protein [Actinobacteria bacterium]|nr:EAL domain-containing protein [Actinomycetota bacterium]